MTRRLLSRRMLLAGLAAGGGAVGIETAWFRTDPWGGGVDEYLLRGPAPPAPGTIPTFFTPPDEHYLFHGCLTPPEFPTSANLLKLVVEGGPKRVVRWGACWRLKGAPAGYGFAGRRG